MCGNTTCPRIVWPLFMVRLLQRMLYRHVYGRRYAFQWRDLRRRRRAGRLAARAGLAGCAYAPDGWAMARYRRADQLRAREVYDCGLPNLPGRQAACGWREGGAGLL